MPQHFWLVSGSNITQPRPSTDHLNFTPFFYISQALPPPQHDDTSIKAHAMALLFTRVIDGRLLPLIINKIFFF
jgi:hypothetical protein